MTILLATVVYGQTELLTNGGFESWTDGVADGWKSASTASSGIVTQSTEAHSGTYAAQLANATSNKRLASAEMTLEAGTYTFSFYVKSASTEINGSLKPGYALITIDGENYSAGSYNYADATNNITTEWTQISYEFTLNESATVCLLIMNPKSDSKNNIKNADLIIDDASLIKKSDGDSGSGDEGGDEGGNEGSVDLPTTLSNGSFESWTEGVADGWKSASTASNGTVTQSTNAHSGTYAAQLANAKTNKRLASAEMALEAGTYTFIFYAKSASTEINGSLKPGYALITIDGENYSAGSYNYADATNNITTEWTQISYEFTLKESAIVCLVVMNPKSTDDNTYADLIIDDASLTKKTDSGSGDEGGDDNPTIETVSNFPYSVDFTKGFGNFESDGTQVASTDVWKISSSYGAQGSGFVNKVKNVVEGALMTSPIIDFTNVKASRLSFMHEAYKAASVETASQYLKLLVKKTTDSNWTELTIPNWSTSKFVESGDIDLSAYAGSKIQLAFSYSSDENEASTWEIKSLTISEGTTKKESTLTLSPDPAIGLSVGASDTYTITYDGDGTLSVESSDENVAKVEINGKNVTVTAKAVGTTTITISATEGEEYYAPTPVVYNLNVTSSSQNVATWVAAEQTDYENAVALAASYPTNDEKVKLLFSKGTNKNNNVPKYYTTGTGARLYVDNYMVVAAEEGYLVEKVVFTFSGSNYTGGYSANVGTYTTDENVATWEGHSTRITFTASSTSRMQSVIVYYNKTKMNVYGSVTISDEIGKATYTAPVNCIIGDGSVSKYITGLEGNGYTLVEKEAPVVFTGEGVLLSEPGEYTLYTHESLSASNNSKDNLLVGATKTTYAPVGSYILQKKKGADSPKFYHVAQDQENKFDIKGHAYLSKDVLEGQETSGVKVLYFVGDDATVIEEVNEVAETEGAIYNLQGVQVNNSYKGIVIRGGKKFLKK